MLGFALALFVFTQHAGGSGLIAAFVGGLAAESRLHGEREPALGSTDEEGVVIGTFVFFPLGLTGIKLFDQLTWQECVYAGLSLTVVRMLSVAAALIGSGLRLPTVGFMGWFGPRGLASVVLALFVLAGDHRLAHINTLVLTALFTVTLSIVAHGLSAGPLSVRYGAWAATLPSSAGELREASAVPPPRSILQGAGGMTARRGRQPAKGADESAVRRRGVRPDSVLSVG